jgi:2-desacetyl-2-hydroxyethyl bacteriochlorophyllide A dehydrogenase
MRTVVLDEPGHLRATETSPPAAPTPGSALVRVHRVGVCGTDFHAWRGRQPFFTFPRILGHELGVEVVEIGPNDRGLAPGSRCAVEPYLNCGTCRACRLNRGNCCERMRVLGVHTDGGMRELIDVPIEKLHVSRMLDVERLALVETISVGHHAVARAGIGEGETVLIVGAGPIGLAAASSARAIGASIAIADVSPSRLTFAERTLGFERTMQVGETDPIPQIRDVFGGLPSVVIDATGNARSMQTAFSLVAQAGTLVFVGLVQAEIAFNDPEFHRRELTVLASRNALPSDFAAVIRSMESGALDVSPWITHRATLEDVPAVFPEWTDAASGVVKAIVTI